MQTIRNFCIIAHIDHGKSTLADRLLEQTRTVDTHAMTDQVLDNMDLEKERGITIKSHAIQMDYVHKGTRYVLNLIDTPGHVDFSYEVSRAIAACEGALLVVDATQGIEAQTISNLYLALEHELSIIPVLNKIDMPAANIQAVKEEITELLGAQESDILLVSAKENIGTATLLDAIVERIPPPKGNPSAPLRAMVFDSYYDTYRGVVALFRIFDGQMRKGENIRFMNTSYTCEAYEMGVLQLAQIPRETMTAGTVGYLVSGLKNVRDIKVGDTITAANNPATAPLKGFEEVKPMVFSGVYPLESGKFEDLRQALEKLQLNDASLQWEPETSEALGFGFRCGFLGMLHMEIVQARLEREFGVSVLLTVPSVCFRVYMKRGPMREVNTPSQLPETMYLDRIEEPYVRASMVTKAEYIGPVIALCVGKRGELKNQTYLTKDRVELLFSMPLSEMVFDFYDRLKSISRGYASLDYELSGYVPSDMVRLNILLNKERVDTLSSIVHRGKAYEWGKRVCERLRTFITRQMFEVAIQASIGSKVIARETIKAMRKNVTAKCYGGDITRKRKLLERQKQGKKKMRQVGNVEVPQEAFMAVLKWEDTR